MWMWRVAKYVLVNSQKPKRDLRVELSWEQKGTGWRWGSCYGLQTDLKGLFLM